MSLHNHFITQASLFPGALIFTLALPSFCMDACNELKSHLFLSGQLVAVGGVGRPSRAAQPCHEVSSFPSSQCVPQGQGRKEGSHTQLAGSEGPHADRGHSMKPPTKYLYSLLTIWAPRCLLKSFTMDLLVLVASKLQLGRLELLHSLVFSG